MDLFADDGRRSVSVQDAMALGQLTEADFLDEALPAICVARGKTHGCTSGWMRLWRKRRLVMRALLKQKGNADKTDWNG